MQIPFTALKYLTGQLNYGGRVTDDWDRRAITNILDVYFGEAVLDDGYRFSPSGTYYAPPNQDFDGYIRYIDKDLPINDPPEVGGMRMRWRWTQRNLSSPLGFGLAC